MAHRRPSVVVSLQTLVSTALPHTESLSELACLHSFFFVISGFRQINFDGEGIKTDGNRSTLGNRAPPFDFHTLRHSRQ
jgi:hypothetical protein